MSGSVAGQRLRGRLLAGLARPASARLEALAPVGQPVFIFVASGDEATLLLPRDGRVLQHGRPAEVLAAVAGVPLNPSELRLALTGCAPEERPHSADSADMANSAKQFGDDWRVLSDRATDVYLHRDNKGMPWRIVAVVHHTPDAGASAGWRAEYGDFQDGLPHSVRLTSGDRKRFDLRLALSQVELDIPLGPEVFRVEIPRDAEPITLDELRRTGLGVRED